MYLSVTLTVIAVAIGTAFFSYSVSIVQIDSYFKRLAYNTADNVSSLVDAGFYSRLRELVESEEYQIVREVAEEHDDDEKIQLPHAHLQM